MPEDSEVAEGLAALLDLYDDYVATRDTDAARSEQVAGTTVQMPARSRSQEPNNGPPGPRLLANAWSRRGGAE